VAPDGPDGHRSRSVDRRGAAPARLIVSTLVAGFERTRRGRATSFAIGRQREEHHRDDGDDRQPRDAGSLGAGRERVTNRRAPPTRRADRQPIALCLAGSVEWHLDHRSQGGGRVRKRSHKARSRREFDNVSPSSQRGWKEEHCFSIKSVRHCACSRSASCTQEIRSDSTPWNATQIASRTTFLTTQRSVEVS
jgi:hypothetical protein